MIFTLRFNGPAYGLNFDQYSVSNSSPTPSPSTAPIMRGTCLPRCRSTSPSRKVNPSDAPVPVGHHRVRHPVARVHIPLDPPFGQRLIDADSSVYATNEAWREWFKGLQVRSQSGGGGIVCLEPNAGISYMTLHYHNTEDTTSYNFIINSNAARVGHFQHSWPPEFGRLNDSLRHRHGRACCPCRRRRVISEAGPERVGQPGRC